MDNICVSEKCELVEIKLSRDRSVMCVFCRPDLTVFVYTLKRRGSGLEKVGMYFRRDRDLLVVTRKSCNIVRKIKVSETGSFLLDF